MPKVVWSKHWLIRIDLIPGVQEALGDYCVKLPALICTEEAGEGATPNPHVHILASFDADQQKGTEKSPGLIQKMKTHFANTVFEKSDFAFTVWETHGQNTDMEEYVCKGPYKGLKTEPIVRHKSTSFFRDVAQLHEAWWQKHQVILDKSAQKVKKEKQKLEDKMIVVEKCNERVNQLVEEIYGPNKSIGCLTMSALKELVYKAVIQHYKGKVNDHISFPVIQALMFRYAPVPVEAAFGKRMDDKFKYLSDVL